MAYNGPQIVVRRGRDKIRVDKRRNVVDVKAAELGRPLDNLRVARIDRECKLGVGGEQCLQNGLEASVVIRTFELADGACWIGVGCGIVADSDPDAELAEAQAKLVPVRDALGC